MSELQEQCLEPGADEPRKKEERRRETMTTSFIEVRKVEGEPINGKPVYGIFKKKNGDWLGSIYWEPRWNRWVSEPDTGTIWSKDCHKDIANALERLENEEMMLPKKKVCPDCNGTGYDNEEDVCLTCEGTGEGRD